MSRIMNPRRPRAKPFARTFFPGNHWNDVARLNEWSSTRRF